MKIRLTSEVVAAGIAGWLAILGGCWAMFGDVGAGIVLLLGGLGFFAMAWDAHQDKDWR